MNLVHAARNLLLCQSRRIDNEMRRNLYTLASFNNFSGFNEFSVKITNGCGVITTANSVRRALFAKFEEAPSGIEFGSRVLEVCIGATGSQAQLQREWVRVNLYKGLVDDPTLRDWGDWMMFASEANQPYSFTDLKNGHQCLVQFTEALKLSSVSFVLEPNKKHPVSCTESIELIKAVEKTFP